MDMKQGWQQNWDERVLNPNQITGSIWALWLCIKEPCCGRQASFDSGKDAEDMGWGGRHLKMGLSHLCIWEIWPQWESQVCHGTPRELIIILGEIQVGHCLDFTLTEKLFALFLFLTLKVNHFQTMFCPVVPLTSFGKEHWWLMA